MMSVRKKLVLLISITGFLPTLLFSFVIFFEMLEQPFRIMEHSLYDLSVQTLKIYLNNINPSENKYLPFTDKKLWIEIRDGKNIILQSDLAKKIPLEKRFSFISNTISVKFPKKVADLNQDDEDEVTFYIKEFSFPYNGKTFFIKSAYPMEKLQEEIFDIAAGISGGLILSLFLLAAVSYFVSGIILKPLKKMDREIRQISEEHLDRRLGVNLPMDEFGRLSHTLNRLFERLEFSFLNQKQLISDASHELKTPLTMMRFAIEELKQGQSYEEEALLQNVERLNQLALRMERLVKNILDLSALEKGGGIVREEVDLSHILNSLVEDYSILAEPENIKIESYLPSKLFFSGDKEKLRRAFSNLLDNAVKYNKRDGYIKISGIRKNDWISFAIENSSEGIPEDEMDKVFIQFYRVEKSRSKEYGGSGLGLSIVKKIVENHGGSISLKNKDESVEALIKFQVG